MFLYHGSKDIIKVPRFQGSKPYNDYGKGFYCTKHIDLAKEWAVEEERDGFVNKYEFDDYGLKVLNLNGDNYSILHWLTVLLEHRNVNLNTPLVNEGIEFLKERYHVDVESYDVVVGYRADDSYFSFVRAFVSNSISISQLEESMYLGELGMQYFIRSKKAFDRIAFIEAAMVEHKEYYNLRMLRDDKARKRYMELSSNADRNGVYLLDLMRREDKNGSSL